MIIFEQPEYELPIAEDTSVSDSYVTLVQQNEFQQVTITQEQCDDSVRFFSRLRNKTSKRK